MKKEAVEQGASVELMTPELDNHLMAKMEAIAAVGRACERLAEALAAPVYSQNVTINGNITATGQTGLKIGKSGKPRNV